MKFTSWPVRDNYWAQLTKFLTAHDATYFFQIRFNNFVLFLGFRKNYYNNTFSGQSERSVCRHHMSDLV